MLRKRTVIIGNNAGEADHIDPLANFVKCHKRNPFISKEDLKDIGNRDDNIQIFSIICVIVLKIYRPILQNIQ